MNALHFLKPFLCIMILGFVACKKIDSEKELIGKWNTTNEKSIVVDAGMYTPILNAAIQSADIKLPDTFIFNADNKGSLTHEETQFDFTYTHDKTQIVIKMDKPVDEDDSVFKFNGQLIFAYTIDKKKKLTLTLDLKPILKQAMADKPEATVLLNAIVKAEIIGKYQK